MENILFKSLEIGITHFEEIYRLLRAYKLERDNLKGMLRADYTFITDEMSKSRQNLDDAKSLNIDYIKNRLYRFHFEFLSRAQLPQSTLDSSISEMGDKYELSANIFNFD